MWGCPEEKGDKEGEESRKRERTNVNEKEDTGRDFEEQ